MSKLRCCYEEMILMKKKNFQVVLIVKGPGRGMLHAFITSFAQNFLTKMGSQTIRNPSPFGSDTININFEKKNSKKNYDSLKNCQDTIVTIHIFPNFYDICLGINEYVKF